MNKYYKTKEQAELSKDYLPGVTKAEYINCMSKWAIVFDIKCVLSVEQ